LRGGLSAVPNPVSDARTMALTDSEIATLPVLAPGWRWETASPYTGAKQGDPVQNRQECPTIFDFVLFSKKASPKLQAPQADAAYGHERDTLAG
jgi:hypothetical protein